MAGEIARLYQIYYRESQLSGLYPFAIPHFNPKLTVFFENSVIPGVVLSSDAKKIGVCSPALRSKINNRIPMREEFTQEVINRDYDVLSFTRRQNPSKGPESHFMLAKMDHWHPGSRETFNMILECIGIQPFHNRREPKDPIYQNAFMAHASIYRDYVNSCLVPAMEVMQQDGELRKRCYEDSQYFKLKTEPGYRNLIKDQLGMDYVPMHTFLLERLFSCWINGKGLNVQYL